MHSDKKYKHKISLDAPCVNLKEDDKFERGAFVKTIAHFLSIPLGSASQVVALNAPWGFGKTSVINFIIEEIEQKKDFLVVNFNPWIISNKEQIINSFLLQIAATLKGSQQTCKVTDKIIQYALSFGPWAVAGASLALDPTGISAVTIKKAFDASDAIQKVKSQIIDKNLNNYNLGKLKQEVNEALNNKHKSVLIVIDDIDRLPPDEIRIIIQLIKAVADFDNISYLLAFEEEPVIKALSYSGIYDGKKYLEKIIHREFTLPKLSWLNKMNFLKTLLDNIIFRDEIEFGEIDRELYSYLLNETALVRTLDTPRDICRLSSKVLTTSYSLGKEISFADIVVWETLELKFPQVTKKIRERPDLITGNFSFDENVIYNDTKEQAAYLYTNDDKVENKSFKDELVKNEKTAKKQGEIRDLLDFIFPYQANTTREYRYNISTRISSSNHKNNLANLLFGGVSIESVSIEEIREFFRMPEIRQQVLLSNKTDGKLQNWFFIAKEVLAKDEVNIADRNGLIDLLLSFKLNYKENRQIGEYFSDIFKIIYDKSENAYKQVLARQILTSYNFTISSYFICRLLDDEEMYSKGQYIAIDEFIELRNIHNSQKIEQIRLLDKMRQLWVSHLEKKLTTDINIFTNRQDYTNIIFRWGQLCMDFTPVQKYIQALVTNDKIIYEEILEFYSFSWEGIENWFGDLSAVINDLEKLSTRTEKLNSALAYLKLKNIFQR